jgi:hypothetical protein
MLDGSELWIDVPVVTMTQVECEPRHKGAAK